MHAMGKHVTQISMNARAVVGVSEVNCLGMLGMLGCGMSSQLLIGEDEEIVYRPVGWGGVGGFGRTPPPVQARSACPIGKLVPPAQLGPACRSWFRFFPLLSAYHELFFAYELINYFTCMTLYTELYSMQAELHPGSGCG